MSATYLDQTQLTESVRFEYGFALESVTFLDRLNYFSPYGRITYDMGADEVVQVSYASGTPPAALIAAEGDTDLELQQNVAALALFPRVSLRDGRARVQRTASWEVGYRKTIGSQTLSAAVYTEELTNSAVTMIGPEGVVAGSDLLPDLFSNSWTLNAGHFQTVGYLAAITQNIAPRLDVTLAYGSSGALVADAGEELQTGSPDELRAAIRRGRRHGLTARVSGALPGSGTQFATSYHWTSVRSLTPSHIFMTQRVREGQGLTIRLRQPIPYFSGLPGQIEATAELRNLLAQGYVPLVSGGRRLYLMQTPRSVRGGLSFIF
jgi:hypothetical protein